MNRQYIILLALILGFTGCKNKEFFGDGVSGELAAYRHSVINDVVYTLSFSVPEGKEKEIPASETITFSLTSTEKPVLLDFRTPEGYLRQITINGNKIDPEVKNNHIVLPKKILRAGANSVTIDFRAGEMSLNRNDDYLYTLFVPDRASTAFPCFDQPDIKAIFNLTLDIPYNYEAIANNPVAKADTLNGRKVITFECGEKISTYLFAFATGKFQRIEKEIDGFKMEMLHRETRKEYVENNTEEIFRLHFNSIRWLEDYTGIKYPFPKFGFVLIPSFQYSGMEHPGAITYRASGLFLDESPTLNEKLGRATLIAHETAHIWFGDLVTMKWFNDVWLKEVFAGYMSDKIICPAFPAINHEMRFLLSRYHSAYNVDRTTGTNPIIQNLDNLKDAGSLYGAIIYNKAPIMMKHLEQTTGEKELRDGVRIYLDRYRYENAEWDDLVSIIEETTGKQFKQWSQVWVREPGMPTLIPMTSQRGREYKTIYVEIDPFDRNRHWPQSLKCRIITSDGSFGGEIVPGDTSSAIFTSSLPQCIIPDTTGIAYGCFEVNNGTLMYFNKHIADFSNPIERGTLYINLYESIFAGNLPLENIFSTMFNALRCETDIQLQAFLSAQMSTVFWERLNANERKYFGSKIEDFAWGKIVGESEPSVSRIWFTLFRNVAMTESALSRLYSIWDTGMLPGNVKLSEDDLCTLAFNLALKGYDGSDTIIARQYKRISGPDRQKHFAFVTPALSKNEAVRDAFFSSLSKAENREHEPWVIEALGYLHHPLMSASAEKYIYPSLEMLEEIKETGDIFFPTSWILTTLSGHHSPEAVSIVDDFLASHHHYPDDLRLKILQAQDLMMIEK